MNFNFLNINFYLFKYRSFLDTFFKKYEKKQGQRELLKIKEGRQISQNELLFFGIFSGSAIVLAIVIIIICWLGDINFQDDEVFASIFPMFRGAFLFILYLALLAFNVYGWSLFNINYKLILGFNYHYSQYYEILKRVAFFSSIILVSALFYLFYHLEFLEDPNNYQIYVPLAVWTCLMVYLISPHRRMFNYEGIFSYSYLF